MTNVVCVIAFGMKFVLAAASFFLALTAFADVTVECNAVATFTQQPTNVVSCAGETTVLTAKFFGAYGNTSTSGGGHILFAQTHYIQWRLNQTNIPGATDIIAPVPQAETTISLVLTNATADMKGNYDVVISNKCNVLISEIAHLAVGPLVVNQPQTTTGQVAQAATFQVQAEGRGVLSYQWRLDGTNLVDGGNVSGVQSNRLTINPLLYSFEGNYDVIVRNDCSSFNSTTSSVARLRIAPGLEWVFRTTNGPDSRAQHSMVYDSIRGVSIMFGGSRIASGPVPLGDLWEWDGARWSQRLKHTPTNGWLRNNLGFYELPDYQTVPVPRYNYGASFDSRRSRMVIFGGQTITPDGFNMELRDTWEWDGLRWYFRGTNGPSARAYTSMAFDSARAVSVLYGGTAGSPENVEVAEWDGNTWTKTIPTNGPASNYSHVYGRSAYDSFRQQLLYGPAVDSVRFWNWDGLKWIARDNGFPFPGGVTVYPGMAFDSYRRRIVYFGGEISSGVNSTWNREGDSWEQVFPPIAPAGRSRMGFAFDSRRSVSVLQGGQLATFVATNDTWELRAVDKPLINNGPASQYRVVGETATFTVDAVGPGPLAYEWRRDGNLINDGGRISGAATSSLTIANVTTNDAAAYTVRVSNVCGVTESFPALLVFDVRLQIFTSTNTSTLIWAAPNVVLEQADNLNGPWTEVVGASSPFNVGKSPGNKFFRLRMVSP